MRGCYEQLTGGRTATKFQLNKNYCFRSEVTKIWGYEGTKSWSLVDNNGKAQYDSLRLCRVDPKDGSEPATPCNFQKVDPEADNCGVATQISDTIKAPDDINNPVNNKRKTWL